MNMDTFAMFPQVEEVYDAFDAKEYIEKKIDLFFMGLDEIILYSQVEGVSESDETVALDDAWYHLEEEDQLLFLIDFLGISDSADFKRYYKRYKIKKLGLLG